LRNLRSLGNTRITKPERQSSNLHSDISAAETMNFPGTGSGLGGGLGSGIPGIPSAGAAGARPGVQGFDPNDPNVKMVCAFPSSARPREFL